MFARRDFGARELPNRQPRSRFDRHEELRHARPAFLGAWAQHLIHELGTSTPSTLGTSTPLGTCQRLQRASRHDRPLSRLRVPLLGCVEGVPKRQTRRRVSGRQFQARRALRRSSASARLTTAQPCRSGPDLNARFPTGRRAALCPYEAISAIASDCHSPNALQ